MCCLYCVAHAYVDIVIVCWNRSADAENAMLLAALVTEVMEQYGPKRFVALVTDNAKNMVNMWRAVLEKYPHMIECR